MCNTIVPANHTAYGKFYSFTLEDTCYSRIQAWQGIEPLFLDDATGRLITKRDFRWSENFEFRGVVYELPSQQ